MCDPFNRLLPSKHTTLFQRPSDVHDDQMTLKRRQNNVLCLQGDFCLLENGDNNNKKRAYVRAKENSCQIGCFSEILS